MQSLLKVPINQTLETTFYQHITEFVMKGKWKKKKQSSMYLYEILRGHDTISRPQPCTPTIYLIARS